MKKALVLWICQFFLISCTQLTSEEQVIKDSLNKSIDLGMFEEVIKSDTSVSFEGFRNRFSYLFLVYLQDGCKPCFQEYVLWQNQMKDLDIADNFTILFIIHSESYEKFISDLMIYEPEFDLLSERFFLVIDPDQKYVDANSNIDPRIIEKSIMIDDKNKIKLIGRPFASKQMTELFQNIIRE